jgi:hypothetical protein
MKHKFGLLRRGVVGLIALSTMLVGRDVRGQNNELVRYNVVWSTQSTSAADSMPLAGGVLGLNVWVEQNDLLFLIGSPNCMDDNGMQTKLGLIRVHLPPTILDNKFRQELDLSKSEIRVNETTKGGESISISLWCDVNKPVIHLKATSDKAIDVAVSYETWSTFDATFVDGGLQWVRRLPEVNRRRLHDMQAQGMEDFAKAIPDPLSGLTEGGRLVANGMQPGGMSVGKFNGLDTKVWTLKTAQPTTTLDLCMVLRMEQDPSAADWETRLAETTKQAVSTAATDYVADQAWWKAFWNRSYVTINPGAGPTDKGWQVGQHYQLFRYMLAANRNGRAMTLFNGGGFTCTGNPDARLWGSCQYMAQNQRLVYWPMLKSGDFDMLKVALDFYRDRTEMSCLHAKKFWGVDGVAYSEPFSIFGLDSIGTNADGRSSPDHLHYHYTSGMEFALMMLEWGAYTGEYRQDYLAPAQGIISYYDEFYQKSYRKLLGKPLDDQGRLVIYPSDACEPYHGCTNNTDVLAGLTALSRELLSLPDGMLTPAQRNYYTQFQKRIPPFPIKEVDGHRYYAAAQSWKWVFYNGNMDFPQMYVCFPFNVVSLGRPGLDVANATWDYSAIRPAVQRQNQCWYQSAINLARLGRTFEARDRVREKFLHSSARFPTFWENPGFDQMPDTDHGGSAMIALQEMIMQTDGKRILLAPAWPADWNCDFKLHAPYQTTVEGRVVGGKVVVTSVTPDSRRKDIVLYVPTPVPPPPLSQGKLATASSVYAFGYEAEKAVDGKDESRWAAASGVYSGWLQVDLGQYMIIGKAVIKEIDWAETQSFTIEYRQGETWKEIARGTTIGERREIDVAPVTARYVRLNITKAKKEPNINEFQLFPPNPATSRK